jgi:peptide/nickel transport system substrate-binding protein
VRLANLRSGQLDFIERLAPSDVPQVRSDSRFRIAKIVELGYQGITINVAKSDLAQKNPLGKDPRVREAFELSIDREALVKVAMEGEAQAGNQWVPPSNRYYAQSVPIAKRNLERAKQLLKEAGVTNPSFTLMTPTASDAQRIAQVVQAMAKEAGFDVKIQSTEFAAALKLQDQGQFEAFVLAWSGRADPDANLHQFLSCKGPLNGSGYCQNDVEARINEARTSLDPKQRAAAYEKIAQQVQKDRPIVYLFHRNWLWAHNAKLTGLRTVPDGMVRVQGLRMN